MKYLNPYESFKSFKLLESNKYLELKNTIEDLKDILLELSDIGFSVEYEKRGMSHTHESYYVTIGRSLSS